MKKIIALYVVLNFQNMILASESDTNQPVANTGQKAHTTSVIFFNNNRHRIIQTVSGDQEYEIRTTTQSRARNPAQRYLQVRAAQNYANEQSEDLRIGTEIPAATNQATSPNGESASITFINDNTHNITQRTRLEPVVTGDTTMKEIDDITIRPQQEKSSSLPFLAPVTSFLGKATYLIGGLLLGYGAVLAKLYYDSYEITQENTWSSWQAQIPIETLQINEQQVAQNLFQTMQQHYASKTATVQFLSPLIYFINDVDAELSFLRRFLALHGWLAYLKISSIFPGQDDTQKMATEKIYRLEYLKQIVINYVGEYKTDKHAPCT